MDSNFSYQQHDQSYTQYKPGSIITPKKDDLNNYSFFNSTMDTTISGQMNLDRSAITHVNNMNYINNINTPKVSKNLNNVYEDTIRTPLKKSRRRECTPMYSPPDSDDEEIKENQIVQNNQNHQNHQSINLTNTFNSNNNFSMMNNYNLLKNNNSNFPKLINVPSGKNFQKLTKSKFLEKIDSDIYKTSDDIMESEEILRKIKGAYLLNLLELDGNNFNMRPSISQSIYKVIVEDQDLFNKVTNLICFTFFEGFNNRSQIIYKFIKAAILEIVNQPLNGLNESLELMSTFIINLSPDYSNYQIDYQANEHKYIFSVSGNCTLNTPNKEVMNFVISFRIGVINVNDEILREDKFKIDELILVDFIKIKVGDE